ncbi:MAG TPA: ABC transporter ATP-binding protein [Polyangiaceae bacterium]
MTALLAEDVHKSYGRRHVLRGASFEANAGQLVAILGENGSGKSTLLRILAGTGELDRGRVERSGRIGYCPQEQVLYPYLTIDEHLELFARAYGLSRDVAKKRGDALAARFDFAARRRDVVEELSGGTRQKLNLAIALLHDPAIVLLDEPYAGLDIESYRAFVAWAEDAKRDGKCIVVITHLALDRDRFDVVFNLRDGRIRAGDA